jgi:hypothetical protein
VISPLLLLSGRPSSAAFALWRDVRRRRRRPGDGAGSSFFEVKVSKESKKAAGQPKPAIRPEARALARLILRSMRTIRLADLERGPRRIVRSPATEIEAAR